MGSPFSGGSPFGGSALPPLGTPPSCLAGSLASELPQLELPSAAYAAQVLNAVEARNLKVREEMGLP